MAYQWFPGHMTKTIREMQEDIRLVDLVIELADARIPLSSRNPEVEKLSSGKARLLLLGKSDLADPHENEKWLSAFRAEKLSVSLLDARNNQSARSLLPIIRQACSERIERNKRRGIIGRPLRAMVVGIPNVGKSTFINSFAGRATARTGDKPGITRGRQWIRLHKDLELLDTPGILWPRFEDEKTGENLALIGAISDDTLDMEELAHLAIRRLKVLSPGALCARYGIAENETEEEILTGIAKRCSAILPGDLPDLKKASGILIREFRSAVLGRVTLERTEDVNSAGSIYDG